MEFKVSAVVKKDNKWFIGFLDGPEFKETKQIKRLKDVKDVTNYKTFSKYLKDKKLAPTLEKLVLKQLNLDSIYILDRPIDPSSEEFEAWWWTDVYKICRVCVHECKQSNRIKYLSCKKFEEIR